MSDPKMFSMEWCMKMAGLEGDAEIGAGPTAGDSNLAPDMANASRDELLFEIERLRAIIAGLTDDPEWNG